jgi:hypothetical protein
MASNFKKRNVILSIGKRGLVSRHRGFFALDAEEAYVAKRLAFV